MANPFWAKVSFGDFIKHFRKMTDEQIIADVKNSMDALEDVDGTGDSFGAFMVKCSSERIQQRSEINRANALAGHEKHGHEIKRTQPPRMPTKEEVYDFCAERNLDSSFGREWLEITESRGGKTREGLIIMNWKGALTKYVTARMKNLSNGQRLTNI